MTAVAEHTEHAAHPPTNSGVSNEKMAMWAFLGSECLLFGALISTYLLYRGHSISGRVPKTSTTSRLRRSVRSCC